MMMTSDGKRLVAIYTMSALALCCASPPAVRAAGPQGIQHGWPIDNAGNVLITDAVANRMASSGAGWVRLNFRLGPYASDTPAFYARYDSIVNTLRSKGLQVVGLVTSESWPGDQAAWTTNNFEHTGGNGGNPYLDNVAAITTRIAQRYQNSIKNWEVWNEPDAWTVNNGGGRFSGGSFMYPSNFAYLLKQVHSQFHYYNNLPVNVVSGGIFGHDIAGYSFSGSGADYLDDVYNVGINHTGTFAWTKNTYGAYPLDAVGQHIYMNGGGNVNTAEFSNYLEYVRDVVEKWEGPTVAATKKTWLTEFGWRTDHTTEAIQAANITATGNIIKAKNYIAATQWFQLDDNPNANLYYGLYRTDLTAKPGLNAFKAVTAYEGRQENGATNGTILNYFNSNGGMAVNGSPYDNGSGPFARFWTYGYVQDFDGGSAGKSAIFDTGQRVSGRFWQTYLLGWHQGLKFPTSGEFSSAGATRQNFQGGFMTWTAAGVGTITVGSDNQSSQMSGAITDAPGTSMSLTKVGTGALTLTGVNSYTGFTAVQGGTLISNNGFKTGGLFSIAAGGKAVVPEGSPSAYNPALNQYPQGTNSRASRVSSLVISHNGAPLGTRVYSGQLDLGNSDMVIDYTIGGSPSPLNDVRDMLRAGYNFGAWDGQGIISTGALNTDAFTFALGYAENADLPVPFGTALNGPSFFGQDVDASAVLVKFTWIGDVTLDGILDFQDLSIFNGNYDAGASTGRVWTDGDLNYDGTIDFQDLSLFNGTYNPNKPSLPEPGATALLSALCGVLAFRRRR